MSKYRLGLEILINESFYDNAIMALKKLVYSVKKCDEEDKEDAIKLIEFDRYWNYSVRADIPKLYNLKGDYKGYVDLACRGVTNTRTIFNTLCYCYFNKYVEYGVEGSNIVKFSDIVIDSEQEKECDVYETNDKVHVLFIIPENIDDAGVYEKLAKITKNPVTVYTDCSNSTEYADIGLRDLNFEAYGSEYKGGNITISVLKLPIDKYVNDDIRLYALKLIYEDCDYVKMFQEPDEGLIDLIRLIDTINTNNLLYRYVDNWCDDYRSWIMSKNAANYTIRNKYRNVDMNLRLYGGEFDLVDIRLKDTPLITTSIEGINEKKRKLRETYASASNRNKDINLTLYPFDFGIVVPLEVKNKGTIEVNEKQDELDTGEHNAYINSIMGTIYTAISGLLVKGNVAMLNEYSEKLKERVQKMGQLDLSEIQDLLSKELGIYIYTTDIRIKQTYEANKSNPDAVITKILENRLYVILTRDKCIPIKQWQKQIETFDTDTVLSFVTSYYFDYEGRFNEFLRTLAYISGNAVAVYKYNELNKAAYVMYPYEPTCKSKLFIEFIYIEDDCSYKSELAVGLLALMRKCAFIANYDMYASISFPLVNLLKAINDNPTESVIKLRPYKKHEDDSYIISSDILNPTLTVSDNYVLKSNLENALVNAKVHESVYSLDVFKNVFNQKGTCTVCRKGDCISIAANEKLKGGYEQINPWFILFILLITVLVTYIIVMICNACKNNELFTASKK